MGFDFGAYNQHERFAFFGVQPEFGNERPNKGLERRGISCGRIPPSCFAYVVQQGFE